MQEYLYEHASRSLKDLKLGGKVEPSGQPTAFDPASWFASTPVVNPGDEDIRIHRGVDPSDISLAVGGGDAGGHSSFFPSWSRTRSAALITKEIPT